jgi:uncharacterized hydrophobic protein (TIGR00271 family)
VNSIGFRGICRGGFTVKAGKVLHMQTEQQASGKFEWLRTSPERIRVVIEEINYGSEPKISFYAMLATASLIAGIGLIANSASVIIGAMVVSPLMTPIIGIALGLVLGDPALLGRALRAEFYGVLLAIGIAALLGMFPLALQVTPEMLARTEPNLLDLLVAVLAGFAGTYALIDARLSPALPGVAIATAIVPPLANSGLCLAMGAYRGAYGSFLLFFANFLAILLVSAATFIAAGLAPRIRWTKKTELARRFGLAVAGFILVGAYLTYSLVEIVRERRLSNAVSAVITSEFSQLPATSLSGLIQRFYEGKLYILASVRTPKIIPPDRIKTTQEVLTRELQMPIELIVRCILARDVSATGSTSQVTAQNLDGFFLTHKLAPDVLKVQEAEQVLREMLTARPDLNLLDVDLLNFPRGQVILATIQGSRVLIPLEVQNFQKAVQERLKDPGIQLLVRCSSTVDVDDKGRVLYGWAHLGAQTPEEQETLKRIEAAVREEFKKFSDVFAANVDAAPQEHFWGVRVEAVGARVMSVREVALLEKAVSRRLGKPVKIYLWSRSEIMATPEGYASMEEFTRKRLQEEVEAAERAKPLPPAAPGPAAP